MLIYLEIGKIISLAGWGLIILLVGLGFLVGLLRGMKKSIYCTILFIVMLVLCWFISMPIAKAMYNGSLLWNTAGGILPFDEIDTSGVNSFSDFVRVLIDTKLTDPMTETATIGETLLSNKEAIALIDGLIIMVVRLVTLIILLIVAKIVFFIIGGLVWIFFLKPPRENADGEPYKKHALIGGLVGGFKGLISSMVFLIPISSIVGVVATLKLPEASTASNQDVKKLDLGDSSDLLNQIVTVCQDYNNGSIAKIYDFMSFGGKKGFDDIIMDSLLSIGVKDEKNIVLREELVNLISIYNSFESTIGIDNVSDYDYAGSLNDEEMVKLVKSATEVLSNSRFVTYLLKAAGAEATAFAKTTLEKSDANFSLLFEDVDLTDKTSEWWKTQIVGIGNVYESLAAMNLDITAIKNNNYSDAIQGVTTEKFNKFVDSLFDIDIVSMFVNGGLKYAMTKLPDDYAENSDAIIESLVDVDDGVKKEIKCFARLIDIFKSDVQFQGGSVNLDSIKISTLDKIVETEVLKDSVLVNKVLGTFLEKQLSSLDFEGEKININPDIFKDEDFSWQDEVADLVAVLETGLGSDFSIGNLQNLQQEDLTVGKIADMLKTPEAKDSMLVNELLSGLAPAFLGSFVGEDVNLSDITWSDELKTVGSILEIMFDRSTSLSDLGNFSFETLTLKKLDNLIKNDDVWSSKFLKTLMNEKVLEYVKTIDLGSGNIALSTDFKVDDVVWRNEFKGILNIALTLSSKTGDERYTDSISVLSSGFGDSIKVATLDALDTAINEKVDSKYTALLLNELANSLLKQFLGENVGEARVEMNALVDITNVLDDNEEGFGSINLNNMSTLSSGEMKKTKLVSLFTAVEENIAASTYLKSLMKDNLTFGSTPLNTTEWTNAKWEEEMHCTKTVISNLQADASGNVNLSTTATSLQTAVPIDLIDAIILLETGKTNRIIGRSNILQNLLSQSLSSIVGNTSTWNATKWDTEMYSLMTVAKTLANSSDTTINVAGITSGLSTIKDATLLSLKTNVPSSEVLQKVFKDALVSANVITNATVITSWNDEMYALIEVARTFENASNELALSSLSSMTSISLASMNSIKAKETATAHTNVARSVVLKSTMGSKLGTALGVNMSAWTDAKWDSEIVPIINVMATMVNGTSETADKDRVITISSLTFDENTAIKDVTLVSLKTNVPDSEALQKMFGDALVSASLITTVSDITSWADEMYGLIEVAKTFENANNELVLSSLTTISSISQTSLSSLKAKETATAHTNVARSVVLKKTMASNLSTILSTDMSSWDVEKWDNEIVPIINVMDTLATSGVINITSALNASTSIKSTTLTALENNVPESEALQNMFYSILKAALGTNTPRIATPSTYSYDEYKAWWTPEMQGIISILESQVVSGSVSVDSLSDFDNLKVSMLDALIDIEDLSRVGFKTNLGKTTIIQYAISPSIITFADTANGTTGFVIDSTYDWDIEMTALVNMIKAQLTSYDTNGAPIALEESDSMDITTMNFALQETAGKASVAKNKAVLDALKDNIDGSTTLQYALRTMINDMADTEYPLVKLIANWTNDDWKREIATLTETAKEFMTEDSPVFSDTSINIYSLTGTIGLDKVVNNSSQSYLLQSMLSSALVTAGINRYNDAYANSELFINNIRNASWASDVNTDWAVMMTVINEKINFFSKIGTGVTIGGTLPNITLEKDGETVASIVITYSGLEVTDVDILDAEGNSYFTSLSAEPTHAELVRRDVEKALIAEAVYTGVSNTTVRDAIIAGINTK